MPVLGENGKLLADPLEAKRKIKLAFDEAGIVIPYPQMDVHIQNHSQDTERKQEK